MKSAANTTDRVAALLLLALAVAAAAYTRRFEIAFLADPLGPRAAPLLLAGVLALSAAVILLRPGPAAVWPDRPARTRILLAVFGFLLFALLLETLGFVLATTLLIAGLALVLGGRPAAAVAAGATFSTAAYYLFVFALDVALPIGRIFRFLGG